MTSSTPSTPAPSSPTMSKKEAALVNHNGTATSPPSKTTATKTLPSRRSTNPLILLLSFLFHSTLHLVLFVAFLGLATVYCLSTFHDDYFVPIVQRAERTDEDLQDELTYYNRGCSVLDLTATRAQANALYYQSLPTDSPASRQAKADSAVNALMLHGGVMLADLLSKETITNLRKYVMETNEVVRGTAAQFPMSQGKKRVSFGIEPTDDPSISAALKEIHDHPLFPQVIQQVLGDKNPALSEITAITAGFGAHHQAWHPDVKADGNALMFGRTYSHSYSLFIPLQNTTYDMGPTDLCPGTHMCADDLSNLCSVYKIGLHEVRPKEKHQQPMWKEGDGFVLNQQAWHRGTGHFKEGGLDRVVFIVSFLARPTDPRQLSRGTYFHQKWLNWGATWQDMADSATSMARPWSILRCLHLWKPRDRQYGFDLFTASALRIANGQKGCEPEELAIFVTEVMRGLGLPKFLDGTVNLENENAWLVYFRETIHNYYTFFQAVNVLAHGFFVVVVVLLASVLHVFERQSFGTSVVKSVKRLLWTHGLVVALTLGVLYAVRSSQWAQDISSGKSWMRPFPYYEDVWRRDDDEMVVSGSTTLPSRFDVLVGTRLNARSIGAYRYWLDYHPGNQLFNEYIDKYGGRRFRSIYKGESLPATMAGEVIEAGKNIITKRRRARFLGQDYRTGDWREMNDSESRMYIQMRLFVGSRDTLLGTLKEEIDYLFDEYRHGVKRKALSMSWRSQLFLTDLAKRLFTAWPGRVEEKKEDGKKSSNVFRLYHIPAAPHHYSANERDKRGIRSFLNGKSYPAFQFGQEVEVVHAEGGYQVYGGTVTEVSKYGGGYDVAFYGDHVEKISSIKYNLQRELIITRGPMKEGARIITRRNKEWNSARILYVSPDGYVDVEFMLDGKVRENIPPWRYYFE